MIRKTDLIELLKGFPEEFPVEMLFSAVQSLASSGLTTAQHDAIELAAKQVEREGGTSLEDLKAEMAPASSR